MTNIHTINNYITEVLKDRGNYTGQTDEKIYFYVSDNTICDIISYGNTSIIRIGDKYKESIKKFLDETNIVKVITDKDFYKKILRSEGLNPDDYTFTPPDEFIEDIDYNCSHTLEYICNKEMFIPCNTDIDVTVINRGDDKFFLEEQFDDKMYCIYRKQNGKL